jgi:transposase-like protein
MRSPFRYFNSSPEVIRLVVMMYVRYPLSLRNVEDLLAERGIDISHETVRFWWNRFGPMFAADIRKMRVAHLHHFPQWRWHLDEVFVKINGKLCYLWRPVDHEGEVLETVVTAKRDKAAALKFLKRIMKKYGQPRSVVTDGLCAYAAAMKEIGNAHADFALMLSGHTHGGQICLPGGIPILLEADLPRAFGAGAGAWRHAGMAGYTSVGAGSSVVPVRFNNRPEITLHQFVRGNPQ